MAYRKYKTEEERIEVKNRKAREYMRAKRGLSSRDKFINKHKKVIINEKDGFKTIIETMVRILLDVVIINMQVNYKYIQDVDWSRYRRAIGDTINAWLSAQDVWDKKNKIVIYEFPETNPYYQGIYRCFNFQIYLKRDDTSDDNWKRLLTTITPILEPLKEIIKNTASEDGIVITHRYSYNPKMRGEGLALEVNDSGIGTIDASEP